MVTRRLQETDFIEPW